MDTATDDGLRERIDGLAERHQLEPRVADTLESYVRLLDLDAGNLLPPTAPELPEPNQRFTEEQLTYAIRMVGEALAALELEPVRDAGLIADIGTGAGFPGMVIAIALPETRVALVDSDADKSGFLRAVSAHLGLDNVEVVATPLQSWTEGVGACDVVTSRKVWRAETIFEHVAPLLAPGGVTIRFQKRRDAEKEAAAEAAAEAHGLKLETIHAATTETRQGTLRTGKRNLVLYRKVG